MALLDMILVATLNDQAESYKEEGRYADAEPLYKRSLAITEQSLGPSQCAEVDYQFEDREVAGLARAPRAATRPPRRR